MTRTVIVGASVSGTKTALFLRDEGYDGDIVVLGDENEHPYDKPALSKQILAGTITEQDNLLLSPAEAEVARIELRLGHAAVSLDASGRTVSLDDGQTIGYDTVVIATGVRARPSPWGLPAGAHLLRTIADARALRSELLLGGHLVVIGGGFIGAEAAGTAKKLGMTVEIVDPVPVPMSRVLGDEVGAIISAIHPDNGVSTRFGVGVSGISVDPSRKAPAGHPGLLVELTEGTSLAADVVLIGIGAVPNQEWLAGSGLQVENGIACDEFSRALGADDVYAVGDIARWWHPRHAEYVRVEHWTTAIEHAQCVAYNIVHPDGPRAFAPVEYIWSNQHDWKIQIAGRTGIGSALIVTDPADPRRFAALYSEDGAHYLGAMVANAPRALLAARRAVGTPVTIDQLAADVGRIFSRAT